MKSQKRVSCFVNSKHTSAVNEPFKVVESALKKTDFTFPVFVEVHSQNLAALVFYFEKETSIPVMLEEIESGIEAFLKEKDPRRILINAQAYGIMGNVDDTLVRLGAYIKMRGIEPEDITLRLGTKVTPVCESHENVDWVSVLRRHISTYGFKSGEDIGTRGLQEAMRSVEAT